MRRNPSGDSVAAHELALYAVNNGELYRQRIVPVIANLQKKIRKGVYDPALAAFARRGERPQSTPECWRHSEK